MLVHSDHKLLSSRLLSKTSRLKELLLLHPLFRVVWNLVLTSREQHRLSALKNIVLRRIFGRKSAEVAEAGENYMKKIFKMCTLHQIYTLGYSNQGG
jgi:hypothetical protein